MKKAIIILSLVFAIIMLTLATISAQSIETKSLFKDNYSTIGSIKYINAIDSSYCLLSLKHGIIQNDFSLSDILHLLIAIRELDQSENSGEYIGLNKCSIRKEEFSKGNQWFFSINYSIGHSEYQITNIAYLVGYLKSNTINLLDCVYGKKI